MARYSLPRGRSTPVLARRRDDERGASAVEMVIIFPVTLFIVFGIIQVGVWYYAASIARSAAQQGAQVEAVYNANRGQGTATANHVIAENGSTLLHDVNVADSRTAQQSTVTVKAHALSIIPFIPLGITASATVPVEAFHTGNNRA